MQSNTILLSPITAGLANMLCLAGHSTTEQQIILGMEAPWLFCHDSCRYLAGAGLFSPKWLNLYAQAHGFCLMEHSILPEDVPAFLRRTTTAMLPIRHANDQRHMMVFTGYRSSRYEFLNMKPENSTEPDNVSYTSAMLKRRLNGSVTVYTLSNCPVEKADMIPLLLESLDVLDTYYQDLLQIRHQFFTHAEFHALHEPLFRAFMLDELPMTVLSGDSTLFDELRQLNHDYRHVFTRLSPETVQLGERLPYSSIRKCILWLKEDIVDRLYELGVTDEMMEKRHFQIGHS